MLRASQLCYVHLPTFLASFMAYQSSLRYIPFIASQRIQFLSVSRRLGTRSMYSLARGFGVGGKLNLAVGYSGTSRSRSG